MDKQTTMYLAAQEFVAGSTAKEVMEKYDISYASIYNAIKKFDIPYKGRSNRRIYFNEDFFESIDSEEKAYYLGLIMADGNLSDSDNGGRPTRVTLHAVIDDKEILDKLVRIIEFTGDIKHQVQPGSFSDTPILYVQLNSVKMANDLMKLGVMPAKTGYSQLPKLPHSLEHHFIRGYFDGDGCISRCGSFAEFSITSDRNILEQIQGILMRECNLSKTKLKIYKRTSKAVSLRYGGKRQVERIYHYLYNNATLFLNRKYNKFVELFVAG